MDELDMKHAGTQNPATVPPISDQEDKKGKWPPWWRRRDKGKGKGGKSDATAGAQPSAPWNPGKGKGKRWQGAGASVKGANTQKGSGKSKKFKKVWKTW